MYIERRPLPLGILSYMIPHLRTSYSVVICYTVCMNVKTCKQPIMEVQNDVLHVPG